MARIQKKTLLLIFTIFLTFSAQGIELDIGFEPEINHSTKDIQQKDNFSDVFEMNASVRNIGSFECTYRLKADINEVESSENYRVYSRGQQLWPSEIERLKVYASPKNYTGEIEGNLYLQYCGEEELLQEFNSTSTERTVYQDNDSEAPEKLEEISVNKTEANISSNLTNALLVPLESPAFWKTGHADLKNSTALLDYEASFFNDDRNITYAAFNKTTEELLGAYKTDLNVEKKEEEKTLIEKISKENYLIGLIASAVANLILAITLIRTKTDKLKF